MTKYKKIMKGTIFIPIAVFILSSCQPKTPTKLNPLVESSSKIIIKIDGEEFRDLNHNGLQDIYEDPTASLEDRVENLLSQMTLEEKAGMMFINGVSVSKDSKPDGNVGLEGHAANMPNVVENMNSRKMTHFNIWDMPTDPNIFAKWYNNTQLIAEKNKIGHSDNDCF